MPSSRRLDADFSGLWQPQGSYSFDPADPRGARAADLTRYPMTPWGLEKFKANKPAHGDAQNASPTIRPTSVSRRAHRDPM